MEITDVMPIVAAIALTLYCLACNTGKVRKSKTSWIYPAVLSALFGSWTLWAIVCEGPFAFWTEHTRNLWGNQIWFDLLFAAAIGWTFVAPRAKKLRMKLLPWLAIVLGTGCIGFLAMVARMLYLEERASASE